MILVRNSLLALLSLLAAASFFIVIPQSPIQAGIENGNNASKPAPDILIISVDTVRADHLPCYGYKRNTTPNICAFGKENVFFYNAFAPAPMTLASHTSAFTSLYPSEHGAHHPSRGPVPESVTMLPERLNKIGYRTVGINTGLQLSPQANFDQGFDQYLDLSHSKNLSAGLYAASAGTVTHLAKQAINNHTEDASLFVFAHYFHPHHPYESPPHFTVQNSSNATVPQRGEGPDITQAIHRIGKTNNTAKIRELKAQYDAGLRYTDHHVGKLLDWLNTTDRLDEMLVILMSDHGEAFNEHGNMLHSSSVFNTQIRIPLIVSTPQKTQRKVDRAVSLIDIPATINATIPHRIYTERGIPLTIKTQQSRPLIAQRTACEGCLSATISYPWKLIQSKTGDALFNLQQDPAETNAVTYPSKQKELHQSYEPALIESTWIKNSNTSNNNLNQQLVSQLEDLGYLE